MSRLTTSLLASAALFGAASAAHATPMYQAVSFGPSPTVFNTGALTFQGFDTTLGTLNSVEFNINDTQSSYSGSVTNTGSASVTDTLSIATRLAITGLADTPAALTGLSYSTPNATFTFTLAPGDTTTFGPTLQADPNNNATFFLPAASLSQFTGGPFSLAVNGTSPTSFAAGGSETSSVLVTAQGVVSLEYDYTPFTTPTNPVPEPASMALLGAGLLGAGLIRRRV